MVSLQAFKAQGRYRKWAGLWLGALAWFADQQVVSMTAYAHCPQRSPAFVVWVGTVCALVAIVGGCLSLSARRAHSYSPAGTDRFIATLSMLLACVSLLAIILGTSAGLILRCER